MNGESLSALQHMLEIALYLGGILLLPMLISGLIVSVFQAATQVNEQTLSFIPKLAIAALIIMYAGDLMLTTVVEYTIALYQSIPSLL